MATKASKMMMATKGKPKAQALPPLPKRETVTVEESEQAGETLTLSQASGEFAQADAPALEFDGGDDPEFSPGPSSNGDGGAAAEAGPAVLTRDQFYASFKVMHLAPNMVPLPPFPLHSLPIHDAEAREARMASDAIYDIAAETPFLRWLIEPQSLWMQRALVIGSYAIPKAMAVMAEVKAKRARDVSAKPEPEQQPEATGFTADAGGGPLS